MKEKKLLSIIIPTYNRYKYLAGSLDAITCTISSDSIEIIVQDNTEDNTEIVEYLKNKNDSRIIYFHTKNRLTVSENCSKGISNSNGEYVCFIGDDDSLCSAVVDLVTCMKENDIDACNFDATIYHWPDLREKMPQLDSLISPKIKEEIEMVNSKLLLEEQIRNGLQAIYELPRAYHAIISKRVLDKIKEMTGTYFPGPSPDMANAALCCLYVKKQIKIGVPMMVSGYGLSSTGGMGRQRKHIGSLKGKDWLPKDVEERWDKKIPLLWLACTIWPASAIEALNRAGESTMLRDVNYGIIYGETLLQAKCHGINPVLKCKPSFSECCQMIKHIVWRVNEKLTRKEEEKIVNNEVKTLLGATICQNALNSKVDIQNLFQNII